MNLLRAIAKKLNDAADRIEAEAEANALPNKFFEKLNNLVSSSTRATLRLEEVTRRIEVLSLREEKALCGVMLYPKWRTGEGSVLSILMGGHAVLLSAGEQKMFMFDATGPIESFVLKSWGPLVITDVRIGNMSQMTNDSTGIIEGSFGPVDVGYRIFVVAKIPSLPTVE